MSEGLLPLNADQILKPKARRETSVALPEFDGPIRLVQPSADAALKLRVLGARLRKDDGTAEVEATELLLKSSCVDGAGKPLFTDKTVKTFLERISPGGLEQLVMAAQTLLRKPEPDPGAPEGNS